MGTGSARNVRDVILANARLTVDLSAVTDDADLFALGMSSHASVNVMLALEDAFGIEFPDELLRRDVFASIASLGAAIDSLGACTA